ncbi:5'-3' exonuclease [Rosistilla oblonga]|uniref:5'-3' exonuclease n=1 Tax=Rosistilla oblonga TaxID=2527990 RepID=UPI003A96D16F
MDKSQRILLIDVSNVAYCEFHGAREDPKKAITQFRRKIEFFRSPAWFGDWICFCFDFGSFRHELIETYKTGRGEKPAGIDDVLSEMESLSYPLFQVKAKGFEADDCMATIANKYPDQRFVLWSSDKDLHQCLERGRVTMMRSAKRKTDNPGYDIDWRTYDDVFTKYGVSGAQWIDYQTIVGDNVDSIPGCKGVGEVKAAELLQNCGDLKTFYQNPYKSGLTKGFLDKLLNFPERHLQRELVTLRTDVPVSLDCQWCGAVHPGGPENCG